RYSRSPWFRLRRGAGLCSKRRHTATPDNSLPVRFSRRSWLSMTVAGACGALATAGRLGASQTLLDADLAHRIRRVIEEYGEQGFHRTGTTVDRRSGDWLFEHVDRIGAAPAREPFSLSRIDPGACRLLLGDRTVEGLPLFDGTFTGP